MARQKLANHPKISIDVTQESIRCSSMNGERSNKPGPGDFTASEAPGDRLSIFHDALHRRARERILVL